MAAKRLNLTSSTSQDHHCHFLMKSNKWKDASKKNGYRVEEETVSAVLSSLGDMAVLTGITRNAARSANSVYHDGLQLFCKLGHHSIPTPRRAEDLFPGVAYFELRPPSARHRAASITIPKAINETSEPSSTPRSWSFTKSFTTRAHGTLRCDLIDKGQSAIRNGDLTVKTRTHR